MDILAISMTLQGGRDLFFPSNEVYWKSLKIRFIIVGSFIRNFFPRVNFLKGCDNLLLTIAGFNFIGIGLYHIYTDISLLYEDFVPMKKNVLLGLFLLLVWPQSNGMGNCLFQDSFLENPVEICGEYEPALYQSIQDPLDGGRRVYQDNTIIRTEKDRDWDVTTYFQPMKAMEENLVLMYLCRTNKEGGKISWLQLFEKSDTGELTSYSGGNELAKQILKPTKDGFQQFEYTLGPKILFEGEIGFSQQMVELIQQNRVPDIEMLYNLRSRTFFATYAQFLSPPTDDEFNWKIWESQVKKYGKDLVETFCGERLAFETLTRKVRFPEAVPAENIFWVLDRMERINKFPFQKDRVAASAVSRKMDAEYRGVVLPNQGDPPKLFLETSLQTDTFDAGIVMVDTRFVREDSARSKTIHDSLTIKHYISWKMPAQVIAQAGGNLTFVFFATREVSFPLKSVLVPSPFPDIRATLDFFGLDRNEKNKGHMGEGVRTTLLDRYKNFGIGQVVQKTELTLPMERFFSEKALVTLNFSSGDIPGIPSMGNVGLKLYYKRKILTPEQAASLSQTLGE